MAVQPRTNEPEARIAIARRPAPRAFGWFLVRGILAILLPGLTVAALTWILGVWLVVRGATEIVGAFAVSAQSHRAPAILSGVVDGGALATRRTNAATDPTGNVSPA